MGIWCRVRCPILQEYPWTVTLFLHGRPILPIRSCQSLFSWLSTPVFPGHVFTPLEAYNKTFFVSSSQHICINHFSFTQIQWASNGVNTVKKHTCFRTIPIILSKSHWTVKTFRFRDGFFEKWQEEHGYYAPPFFQYLLLRRPWPLAPSPIQVFQQFLSLTIPNARGLQSMDMLKDFLKQPFWNQRLCHLKYHIPRMLDNFSSDLNQFNSESSQWPLSYSLW